MWYVEKLYSIDIENNTLVQEEPCVFCDRSFRHKYNLHVVLRNSDNNDIEQIHGENGTWLCMEKTLRELNPYGFESSSIGVYILARIDKMALKLLGYVDSISFDRSRANTPLLWTVIGYYQQVWFWDEWSTLVGFDNRYNAVKYAFSLFDVIVYMKRGWIADRFYMLGADSAICCVKFTDAGKARALVAKAVASGYNPIERFKKLHVGVMIQQQ